MKRIRFIIILAYIFFGLNVWAQDDRAQGDENIYRPYLNKVSVDPEDPKGKITITWDMPADLQPTLNVDEFVIHWFKPATQTTSASYIDFATALGNRNSYEFYYDDYVSSYTGNDDHKMPDPRKTSVGFSVIAVQKSPYQTTLQSVLHSNMQVTNSYDSCKSEIKLVWYSYGGKNGGWLESTRPNKPFLKYEVRRILSDGSDEFVATTMESVRLDTTYIVRNIDDRGSYKFYIKALRSDGEAATSYATTRITNMPVMPSFITAESAQYNSEGFAEISFKIDPDAETHKYSFYGTRSDRFGWPKLKEYNIYGDTILTDIPPNGRIRGETYFYKLEAQHIYECRTTPPATSNWATALWLTLRQEDAVNLLRWDPYENWNEDEQSRYDIYRKIGDADSVLIASVFDPDQTAYDDDLTNVSIDGDVCYRIIATPKSFSPENMAISNRQCIIPESNIWIPDAFTPNVAGINKEFKPFFSYPPKDYMLYVYDLNGAKVFETKEIDAGWDGRLLNGKHASEGIYVYYLKYRTERGRSVEKKGTFTLIVLP